MKKLKTWIAALIVVSSLSFGASAQEPTIVDENWDNFQKTVKIERKTGEGEVELGGYVYDENSNGYYHFMTGPSLNYGITDNLQMDVAVGYSKFADQDFTLYAEDNMISYFAGLQGKIFDKSGLTISGKGSVSGYQIQQWDPYVQQKVYYRDYDGNIDVAVDKEIRDGLIVHHTTGGTIQRNVETGEWKMPLNFSNGLEYEINDDHAVKGYLFTRVANQRAAHTMNLMYKNTQFDDVTLLSYVQKQLKNPSLKVLNQVAVNPIPGITLLGDLLVNTNGSDRVGVGVQAEKGDLTLHTGFTQHFGGLTGYQINAKAEYQLTEELAVKGAMSKENWKFESEVVETDLSVSLVYKFK